MRNSRAVVAPGSNNNSQPTGLSPTFLVYTQFTWAYALLSHRFTHRVFKIGLRDNQHGYGLCGMKLTNCCQTGWL